jgi:hypothetical protein
MYEEKILDGVLCWKVTPDGEWVQKTAQQLTEMLLEARRGKAPLPYPPMRLGEPQRIDGYAPRQPQSLLPQHPLNPYEIRCWGKPMIVTISANT